MRIPESVNSLYLLLKKHERACIRIHCLSIKLTLNLSLGKKLDYISIRRETLYLLAIMAEDEMNKEEMELRKLALEVKELERPWFSRPANLLSIFSLCFGVYQYLTAEVKIGEANTLISQNEITEEFLEDKAEKIFEAQSSMIKGEKSNIRNEVSVVATGRLMDVWAYGVSESEVQKIKEHLIAEGNEVGFGGLLSYKPKWLALQSTVFYYHKNSKQVAQNIADDLNKISDIEFDIKWGAGLGVKADEKEKTFFVHIVNTGN